MVSLHFGCTRLFIEITLLVVPFHWFQVLEGSGVVGRENEMNFQLYGLKFVVRQVSSFPSAIKSATAGHQGFGTCGGTQSPVRIAAFGE
jgi:hypothetical protein